MLTTTGIKAVFFDAGNTLIHVNHAQIAAFLAELGFDAEVERVRMAEVRARVRIDGLLAEGRSTEAGDTFSAFMDFFLAELEAPARLGPGFMALVVEYNKTNNLWNSPDPGAAESLAGLARAGFRLGVISNADGTVEQLLARMGFTEHLGFVIDSGRVGVEKPDPRIFRMGLEAAGVEPGQAVYVGDLYSVDVLGARSAGMQGVLLDPVGAWPDTDCAVVRDVFELYRLLVPAGDQSE